MPRDKITYTQNHFEFVNVPIITPNGDNLINPINIFIHPGMNTIIIGPNGCGKSSFFRILGQLWPVTQGELRLPQTNKVFYIPQLPYLPKGSLRD